MIRGRVVTTAADERYRAIRRVLWLVLVLNLAVAAAKIVYGALSNSAAMQADGVHSLVDGTSNVVALVGIMLASRPADRSHPYGHGKFETFAAAGIAVLLCVAGYSIGREAISHLLGRGEPTRVDVASFIVMGATLCVNACVTTWESRVGKRLCSEVLRADARHTLSDVLVSSGVIVSLIAVRAGWEQADGVVALVVALVILYTAFSVLRRVGRTLADASRIDADELSRIALQIPGVEGCHHVRTRGPEGSVCADLHLLVAADISVDDGHRIAHEVEARLRETHPEIADVVVHIEPS
jgi:cation diffusion facilitator family transporter